MCIYLLGRNVYGVAFSEFKVFFVYCRASLQAQQQQPLQQMLAQNFAVQNWNSNYQPTAYSQSAQPAAIDPGILLHL